ncbi:MAG: hypothetical protein OEW67_10915, partial [Cyclobacteriaceae bacterium]|nr:hypothetical protein [Cyclobacteriaceae bacterium]
MNRILIILFYLVLALQVKGVFGGTKNENLGKKVEKDKIEEKEERKVDVPLTRQFPSLVLNESIYFEDIADPLKEEKFAGSINDTLAFYRNKATELNQYVKDNNRFTEFLDDKSILDLPIGIKRSIGNLEYTIVIDSLVMTPTHAYLIAYMSFTVPSNGKEITFRGDKIELSKTGGITGNAKLQLLGDYPINIFGENSMLVLQGHQTFVEFDCNGFKEMSVGANIVFSRDMIIPEDVNGNIQEGRVEANFSTTLSDWNDLIVEMSLPDFQVNGVEGVGFSIKNAVFDFSDFRNAPATVFPEDYESTLMLPDNPNLWRGFYLRELSIRLPPQFETKDGSGRTSFEARNLLIDNMGFTGTLAAEHLIKMENGDMSGWAFSLDEIYIQLQANQLKEAGFNGKIIVPMADDQTPFKYTALINRSNEYIFNVTPDEDLQFEVFRTSKIEIYEASYLEIKVVEGKFRPKANLHGKMSISAKMGENESSKSANIADISFESLEIQAVKPYLKVGAFSFGSEDDQQAMAGLPISINNIGMRSLSDTQVGLDFDIIVNLNESFGGEAGLTIVGEIDTEKGYQSWRYNRIDVNKIIIDIDQKPFKFYGQLVFYRDDPVYGNGFNGIIDAEFEPGIKLKATAIFGTVNDNRYWYADAMVEFSSGIPVFTGVGIYGFGGGAYYGMKMDTEGVGSEFGKTNSGVVYVPDPNAGLGLK